MSTNREKILAHALTRFNEAGLEAVGIRDIARELELSPGNVSYHFPKKDDLVVALAAQLGERNTGILATAPGDLGQMIESYRQTFANQADFRFLTVSIVHVFEHNPTIAERYTTNEKARRARLREILTQLQGHGLRDQLTDADLSRLLGHITIHARLWLTEWRISFADKPLDEVGGHYLHLLADLFVPYATPEGLKMLAPYLQAPLLS